MTDHPPSTPRRHKRAASTLRGVRRTLRRRLSRRDSPTRSRGDAAVIDLAAEPLSSVADAHDRISSLESLFQERNDRRAVFLSVYRRVTAAVADRLAAGESARGGQPTIPDGDGGDGAGFRDPEWVGRYLTTFADYYRRALLAFERGDDSAVPEPWQVAFETAVAGENLVVQDALLGVNAHVNHDLAFALREVGIDEHRTAKYRDHAAVNDSLRAVTDDVERILAREYAPALADLDRALGNLDETLSYFSLREARDLAWHHAVALSDDAFGVGGDVARWSIWLTATGGADFVLSPALNRDVLDELAALEGDEPMAGGG